MHEVTWCSDGWLVAYSAERDPLQTHSQVNIYYMINLLLQIIFLS